MYSAMKVHECIGRHGKPVVRLRKFATHKNTRDLVNSNEYWRVIQWVKSLGETQMIDFHTWRCKCEGAGQDSSYGHEESHLIHDMKYSMWDCIFCKECGMMCVCNCMCI